MECPGRRIARRRRRWFGWGVGLAALAVVFVVMMTRPRPANANVEAAEAPLAAVAKVTRGDVVTELPEYAEFRPYQEIEMHAKVAGYLKEIYVDVGDVVTNDQVIATLEIPELQDDIRHADAVLQRSGQEVNSARAEITRAQAGYAESGIIYTNLANTAKVRPGLVAQQDIDVAGARARAKAAELESASAALATAEFRVNEARANLERLRTMATYTRITAPFAGVITKRFADTGALIQQGTASSTQAIPLVRLTENDQLRLVFPVSMSYVPFIKVGLPIEIHIEGIEGSVPGKVSRFSREVDSATRNMHVEALVTNADLKLAPGLYVKVRLEFDRHTNVLTAPVQAISLGESPTVAVIGKDNVLEERPVKIGLRSSDKVEIIAGLSENDLVVVAGRGQLKTGQRVQPKEVELPTAEGKL